MKAYIPERLRDLVLPRANGRREYCLLHQDNEPAYSHEIDPVIADKHLGETLAHNLAFACFYCNCFKGTDLTSIDPLTGQLTPLFNPLTQNWTEQLPWMALRSFLLLV